MNVIDKIIDIATSKPREVAKAEIEALLEIKIVGPSPRELEERELNAIAEEAAKEVRE